MGMNSVHPTFWRLSLATMLLAAACKQLEAQQHLMNSQLSGGTPSTGRQLRQWVGNQTTEAPACELLTATYCNQQNACLPGSYTLDTATYCSCCRPMWGVDYSYYTCGFVNCNANQWNEAVTLPQGSSSCSGKWMKCNPCPSGTFSPPGSDSSYDCKAFSATAPTCYLLKNFSNPNVRPFPGMYFWPMNYTALKLQRLSTGACAGHGLPVQVCLGSNVWSGPNATLYQMWFIMEDGTRLSPYKTAGTNRGNTVIGFMPTSNSTCKWTARNTLYYIDGPKFEIAGSEGCPHSSGGLTYNARRFKFVPPEQPYCTPSLVVA